MKLAIGRSILHEGQTQVESKTAKVTFASNKGVKQMVLEGWQVSQLWGLNDKKCRLSEGHI